MIYSRTAKALTAPLLLLTASSIFAQEVTLVANNNSSRISGEMIAFENSFFIVKTNLGQMRISSDSVTCEGDACPSIAPDEFDLRITGSVTIGEGLMPQMIAGYADHMFAETRSEAGDTPRDVVYHLGAGEPADDQSAADIGDYLVSSSTSSQGFASLLDRTANVAISTRRIHPTEARAIKAAGGGNMVSIGQEHVIAADSLMIIVHRDNPIGEISLDDLAKIYTGEIDNWAQLGGEDRDIQVYARPESSGTWEFFASRVLAGKSFETADWTIEPTDDDTTNDIAQDIAGIGFVGQAFKREAKALDLINACGMRSTPNAFSAKTEDYPLGRRIYAYNRSDNTSVGLSEFLQYTISSDADYVISGSGFVDLGVTRASQSDAETRLQNAVDSTVDPFEMAQLRLMTEEMEDWGRLSSTFRFNAGSTRLDNKAELDMARLMTYLEDQPDGTRIAVVGFTDDDGAYSSNQNLSLTRAKDVLAALRTLAGERLAHIVFEAKGYGQLSPAACNTSTEGKRLNRRVEIWIRGQGSPV